MNKHIASIVLLLLFAQTACAESWGPWSVSAQAPAILSAADKELSHRAQPEQPTHRIAATPFLWLLTFYQKVIGPVNGGRCPMYPTCSQYSVQAIRKHGPVVGIIMTADRLMHEGDEQQYLPLSRVGDRYRFIDPVQDNDFWWYHE